MAWRRLDHVPADPQARLWLFGVARRALSTTRRSAARRSSLGDRLRQQLAGEFNLDPAVVVTRDQLVRQALKQLRSGDREVLMLSAWEQLTSAEILEPTGGVMKRRPDWP